MSESTRCWNCGKKLVNKNGHSRGPLPLLFAVATDGLGNDVRVHKVCLKAASEKRLTAAPVTTYRPSEDSHDPDR